MFFRCLEYTIFDKELRETKEKLDEVKNLAAISKDHTSELVFRLLQTRVLFVL